MKLTHLSVSGFMGFPHDEVATLGDLGQRNVLIGPNSAGKSAIIRFLALVRSWAHATAQLSTQVTEEVHWWWKSDTATPITAEIGLADVSAAAEHLTDADRAWFVPNDEWRFQIEVSSAKTGKAVVTMLPVAHIDGERVASRRQESSGHEVWITEPGSDGKPGLVHQLAQVRLGYPKVCEVLLHSLRQRILIFDPVRSVTNPSEKDGFETGSQLVSHMKRLAATPAAMHKWHAKLLRTINRLLDASGMPRIGRLTLEGAPEGLWIHPHDSRRPPIPLRGMGRGVEQLVIILAALQARAPARAGICLIEEPEVHMHPRLLRHFLHHLGTLVSWRFVITSHSSDLLDTLGPEDRVYRFEQDEKTLACSVSQCVQFDEYSAALDSLGMNGGALLQSNAVIWVEGPSDRLYLRHWIEAADADGRGNAQPLREGADYSFAYYGGSLLAHVTLHGEDDDDDDAGLVRLLRINRYSAVVMDRDDPAGTEDSELAPRKRRILDKTDAEDPHRLAIVTTNREIENEVPAAALVGAAADLLGVDATAIDAAAVTGAEPFEVEIAGQLAPEDEREAGERKLARSKVALAAAVVARLAAESNTERPRYADKIVRFLRRSRAD